MSELFAIGAPTSGLVVPLFTSSSTLLLLFGIGIWVSAGDRRILRWMGAMMVLNCINALVLWNVFPMHMRGQQPTFTDTMHAALAVDPFLTVAVILGAIAFRGRFRRYTIATLVFTTVMAVVSISNVGAVIANEPTPWMGATERAAQYATNLWYVELAVLLLQLPVAGRRSRRTDDAPAGVSRRGGGIALRTPEGADGAVFRRAANIAA